MIEKIKKQLTLKYTFVITLMLVTIFFSGTFMYHRTTVKLVKEALTDYLDEEVLEAGANSSGYIKLPQIHQINADVDSIHNFTYWYADGKLVYAEEALPTEVSELLQMRFQRKKYKDGHIYHENVKYKKVKWYFLLAKQNLVSADGTQNTIIVLSNITPLIHSNKLYLALALWSIVILSGFAYFCSLYLSGKAIKQINAFYERHKRFVADASHELRTPLSVILSYAELLELKNPKDEIIKSLKEEIISMGQLNSKLLQLARSDNDNLNAVWEHFDFLALIKNVVHNMQDTAKAKNIALQTDIEHQLQVKADKDMLRQLLYILLDNALKYTQTGGKVTVKAYKTGDEVEFCVEDTGIGITKEEQPHIFERFYQVNKSRNRNSNGLGLGLSLADIIVRRHHGKISVSSEIGKGSRFTVRLPQEQVER